MERVSACERKIPLYLIGRYLHRAPRQMNLICERLEEVISPTVAFGFRLKFMITVFKTFNDGLLSLSQAFKEVSSPVKEFRVSLKSLPVIMMLASSMFYASRQKR